MNSTTIPVTTLSGNPYGDTNKFLNNIDIHIDRAFDGKRLLIVSPAQVAEELSGKATNMLFWIAHKLPKYQDHIQLSPTEIAKELFLSRPTVYEGIKELMCMNYIKKYTNGVYWINHNKFFTY